MFFSDIDNRLDLIKKVFNRQIELTWCEEIMMFSRNTEDSITLSSRVYELAIALYYNNCTERFTDISKLFNKIIRKYLK